MYYKQEISELHSRKTRQLMHNTSTIMIAIDNSLPTRYNWTSYTHLTECPSLSECQHQWGDILEGNVTFTRQKLHRSQHGHQM
jgi:hypothetical protein